MADCQHRVRSRCRRVPRRPTFRLDTSVQRTCAQRVSHGRVDRPLRQSNDAIGGGERSSRLKRLQGRAIAIEKRLVSMLQRFIGGNDQPSGPMKRILIHDSARLVGHGLRESAVTLHELCLLQYPRAHHANMQLS
jgi:hypothetical protein